MPKQKQMNEEEEKRFGKEQILSSKKYMNDRDILSFVIKENKKYTTKEIEMEIEKFKKGAVKC